MATSDGLETQGPCDKDDEYLGRVRGRSAVVVNKRCYLCRVGRSPDRSEGGTGVVLVSLYQK